MKSKIYWGTIDHYRKYPKPYYFIYPALTFAIELSEAPKINRYWPLIGLDRAALLQLKTADYLSTEKKSLKSKFLDYLQAQQIEEEPDQIYLLTTPRLFGYVFNPVNFYLAYKNNNLILCVAEVNNTFNETHRYLMRSVNDETAGSYVFDKQFFVSPFFERLGQYHLAVTSFTEQLAIVVRLLKDGEDIFVAKLKGQAKMFGWPSLLQTLVVHPATILLVMIRIHWQAIKLYFSVKAELFNKPAPLPESVGRPARLFHALRLALIKNLNIIRGGNKTDISEVKK